MDFIIAKSFAKLAFPCNLKFSPLNWLKLIKYPACNLGWSFERQIQTVSGMTNATVSVEFDVISIETVWAVIAGYGKVGRKSISDQLYRSSVGLQKTMMILGNRPSWYDWENTSEGCSRIIMIYSYSPYTSSYDLIVQLMRLLLHFRK